jgi:hypothetical protein
MEEKDGVDDGTTDMKLFINPSSREIYILCIPVYLLPRPGDVQRGGFFEPLQSPMYKAPFA